MRPESMITGHLKNTAETYKVDISDKDITARTAIASSVVTMSHFAFSQMISGNNSKGDALSTARLAGAVAAKKTYELIPLCHPLQVSAIELELTPNLDNLCVNIIATVKSDARFGVEMEALTAVSVAGLTLYDMLKSADKNIKITNTQLELKTGGASGDFERLESE